jgi:hypothetical protein
MAKTAPVLTALATAGVLALSGCSVTVTDPGTIIHVEHIPASTGSVPECSGAVPFQVCSSREVLQEQCWRIDVRKTWTEFNGQPNEQVDHYCVFPSDFAKMKVGDPWVKPPVTY